MIGGRRANDSIDLWFDASISSPSTGSLAHHYISGGQEESRIRFRSFRDRQGSPRVFVILIFEPLGASPLHAWSWLKM